MSELPAESGNKSATTRANQAASIAMATYNGARFLASQLADLAAQTHLPHELVVCDDGSRDETLQILANFAETAPFPVRIHRNDRTLGYRANFMRAAGLCEGEIVLFCDQDDRWKPDKIEELVRCFADPDVLVAWHQADLIDSQGLELGRLLYTAKPRSGRAPPLSASPWEAPLGLTQAFRASLLRFSSHWPASLDPTTEADPLAHDQWFVFLAGVLGTVAYCPKVLVSYRQHEANTFGAKSFNLPWHERLGRRLRDAEISVGQRMRSAQLRADALHAIAAATTGAERERAREGEIAYRRLARNCALRSAIYGKPDVLGRLAAVASLIARRGYGADPWRFGWAALAMDLAMSVGPRTRLNAAAVAGRQS